MNDVQLLDEYAEHQSADAFRQLVEHHIDTVYSACLRQVRDHHVAEDVVQTVFIILARKATSLRPGIELNGWLLKTTRYAAISALREADRRRRHERKAAAMRNPTSPELPAWEQITPQLDGALLRLSDRDRTAIILRFFQQKSHSHVATALGISEESARQRVSRALQKLRGLLARQGVDLTSSVLSAALPLAMGNKSPLALIEAASNAHLNIGASQGTIVNATLRMMRAATFKAPAIMTAFLFLLTGGIMLGIHETTGNGSTPSQPLAVIAELPTAKLVDAQNRPVSNGYIARETQNIWNGTRSDAQGDFTLPGAGANTHFLAWSQRSRKQAFFTSRPDGSLPPAITLDLDEALGQGYVVDPAGNPVKGANVHLLLTTTDGVVHRFTAGQPTDAAGFYQFATFPRGPGLQLVASLSDRIDDPTATAPIALGHQFQIDVPDLVTRNTITPPANVQRRVRYTGKIVDEQGKGIPGVEVGLSYPKNHMVSDAGDLLTDDQGKFSAVLPPDAADVYFHLTHQFFYADQVATPPLPALLDGTAVISMKRGLSLKGVVHDTAGQPIENALVLTGKGYSTTPGPENEPIEDFTSPRTDKDGKFTATGLPPGPHQVSISTNGYAPEVLAIDLSANTPPLDLKLDAGLTYTARVVDSAGRPIVGAFVGSRGWTVQQQFPLTRFTKTASDGTFTLKDLPTKGTIMLDAYLRKSKLAGTSFNWSPTGKNRESITLYSYPVIKGQVIDEATGKPIPIFKAIPGVDWSGHGFDPLEFSRTKNIRGGDGTFTLQIDGFNTSADSDTKGQAKIVAQGYAPALSPLVRLGEAPAPFVIKLHRVEMLRGVVTDAAGTPMSGASVMLVLPANWATVVGMHLEPASDNLPDSRTTTGRDGEFSLTPADGPTRLLVLDDCGYAIANPIDLKADSTVILTPWATVEGTLKIGGKPALGSQVAIMPLDPAGFASGFHLNFQLGCTVDAEGKFSISHVPALKQQIERMTASVWDHQVPIDPRPGETLKVALGD